MGFTVKDGYVPETREPDRVIHPECGGTVRIFYPDIDAAERERRERRYLRVAEEIFRSRALEALEAERAAQPEGTTQTGQGRRGAPLLPGEKGDEPMLIIGIIFGGIGLMLYGALCLLWRIIVKGAMSGD